MATISLLPNSTITSDWGTIPTTSSIHTVLSDDDNLTLMRTQDQNDTALVTLDDFGESFTSITRIRFYVRGVKFNTRTGDVDIQVKLQSASGTAYYTETVTLNFTAGYAPEDHYGAWRTTYDGSNAWTDTKLDDLRFLGTANWLEKNCQAE